MARLQRIEPSVAVDPLERALPPLMADAADVSPFDKAVQSFGRRIIAWRAWVIVATLVLAVLAGYGVRYLSFNPDSRVFFAASDPERMALDRIEKKYFATNNIVFIVTAKDGDVFTRPVLEAIGALTERAWLLPFAFRVDSLATYQRSRAEDDALIVEPLFDDASRLTAADLHRIRAEALADREIRDRLVGRGGDVSVVGVRLTKPGESRDEASRAAAAARLLAREVAAAHPQIEIRLSGSVIGDVAFAETGRRDTRLLVSLMGVAIMVILWVGLRSASVVLVTAVVIGLSAVVTMGIHGWTGGVLNSGTGGAPVIIMALYFADCVHFVAAVIGFRRLGHGQAEATIAAMRIHAIPVVIKTLTSVIGFLSLNFSDSPPLNELGNLVAAGSTIGGVLTLTFMPAALSALPIPKARDAARWDGPIRAATEFAIRHRQPLLLAFALALPLAALSIMRTTLDDDFIKYFDRSVPFRADTDYLQTHVTGLHVLFYAIPAGEEQGITRPSYMAKLDAFAAWFRGQSQVAHVEALSDRLKRLNTNMNGDDPAFDRLPETREQAAQYLFLYEMSLPRGHDLGTVADIARSESLMLVRLSDVTSKDILRLAEAGAAWLERNAPEMATKATGLSVLYARISERNIPSMLIGTAVSVLAISLIMILVLWDLRIGLISLVPNVIPALLALGLWGFVNGEVNLAVSVVTAMTYGIVVDDTVHMLHRYKWARQRLGLAPLEAVRETCATVWLPLVLTSIALALGFAILALSSFAVTSLMGVLSAMIIAIAMLADLFLLPALLLTFGEAKT